MVTANVRRSSVSFDPWIFEQITLITERAANALKCNASREQGNVAVDGDWLFGVLAGGNHAADVPALSKEDTAEFLLNKRLNPCVSVTKPKLPKSGHKITLLHS